MPDDVPILSHKQYACPTLFEPSALIREARRQKSLAPNDVPAICVLDPDGDLSRHLQNTGAKRHSGWACYHTEMYELALDAATIGVIGCAVGASYAVLVAEQLFVSGCELIISVTSSGQLVEVDDPPYFILIDKALRDEGTSYHYFPPSAYAFRRSALDSLADSILAKAGHVIRGGTWTTDAPYRETAEAIAYAKSLKLLAVEMEASALYAFAEARGKDVICFAHVTNRMATVENDFEKGEHAGNTAMVHLLTIIAREWRAGK